MTKKIKLAEEKTNTNPTELQKEKGNYKKGKVTIKGMKISIENPKGSIRSGVDKNGEEWRIEMPLTYGYFNGTVGKDGDQIDVYLGDYTEEEFDVFVIDQVFEDESFDEHKVMFGFKNEELAKQGYLSCYESDWYGFGKITKFSLSKFKEWVKDNKMIKYPASKTNISSRMEIKNKSSEERTKLIRLFGEVESDKTLLDLKEQAGDPSKFDELVVQIATPGGSVSEGLEIMVWFDELSTMGKKIVTVVVANSYSIGSLIMLAADIKVISKHGKVMVHNPMIPELQYVNANELEKHIEDLRNLENYMYDLYEIFTGLERSKIKELMDNETYLSPQEAVDYGFSDMVVDIKPKSFEMTVNTNKIINMSKTINILNRVIGMVNKSEYVDQTYTDKDGGEIEIHQTDPSTFKKGDKTSVENGEVILSDGSKLTIEDFIITDIDRTLEENETPVEEMPVEENPTEETKSDFNEGAAPIKEEAVEEVEEKTEPAKVIEKTESTITTKEIQNAEITEVTKWEVSVVQDTFEVGTKVEYKPYEDGGDPAGVIAGEYELGDGRKILVDSDSVIQFIKPAPTAKVEENDTEAKEVEETVNKDLEAKLEALEIKNKELEAKLGEIENKLDTEAKDIEDKLEKVNQFQEVAAEAIDTVASNMQSNFQPKPKAKAPKAYGTGSIFQQMKAKAGL